MSVCIHFDHLGIKITGDEVLYVGKNASISCSTDLHVVSVAWLYNGVIITQGAGSSVDLEFSPVNDTINGRQYICRATSAYGIQESSITISVSCKHCEH